MRRRLWSQSPASAETDPRVATLGSVDGWSVPGHVLPMPVCRRLRSMGARPSEGWE